MATAKKSGSSTSKLATIKNRLRENKLTTKDVKQIEKIIVSVEKAAAQLRAAVVE